MVTPFVPLALWEAADSVPPGARMAAMIDAVGHDPAATSLGVATRQILAMREQAISDRLEGYAACPDCGTGNTVTIAHDKLRDATAIDPEAVLAFVWQDLEIKIRQLSPADLADASRTQTVESALAVLRRRTLLEAKSETGSIDAAVLPDAAWNEIDARLEAADGLADPQLSLVCEACGTAWTLSLDISVYFARELRQASLLQLAEVADLASAYGWSEADILAMGPARRRLYLQLSQERQA